MEKGLVHIYCGDGKGKTTAAMGLAFRCAGNGGKVLICQFFKNGSSGEILVAERTDGMEVIGASLSGKFTRDMEAHELKCTEETHGLMLKEAEERIMADAYSMLVLDEVMAAWENELIDKEQLIGLITRRPPELELVMTGRNPPRELMEHADYISEIKKIRHPFDKGIRARKGIEM